MNRIELLLDLRKPLYLNPYFLPHVIELPLNRL